MNASSSAGSIPASCNLLNRAETARLYIAQPSRLGKALVHLYCTVIVLGVTTAAFAGESRCVRCAMPAPPRVEHVCTADDEQPSWIFRRAAYTHDPYTGARVAQYQRLPIVEPLDDERLVTSRYNRTQTNLPGARGSSSQYYETQAWGNGRGGIDAEWERFHSAWKESYLQGSYFNQGPGFGNGFPNQWNGNWGWGGGGWGWNGGGWGWGGPGFGNPWWGNSPGGGFPGIGNGGPWRRQGPGGNNFQSGAAQYNGHGHAGDWN